MIRFLHLLYFFLFFISCRPSVYVHSLASLPPQIQLTDTTKTILIVDATERAERTNSAGALVSNIDQSGIKLIKELLNKQISQQLNKSIRIHDIKNKEEKQGLVNGNSTTVQNLLTQYHAEAIVVILSGEYGFQLAKKEKLNFNDGRVEWIASYNIFFEMNSMILQSNSTYNRKITSAQHHSDWNLVEGKKTYLSAANISTTDFRNIAEANAFKVSQLFTKKQVIEVNSLTNRYFIELAD